MTIDIIQVYMTTFTIKLIAIGTMLLDHIGYVFFPENLALRAIGRVSFPLFAWLISNGAHYSRNIDKYLQRLFLFGLISQVPYMLATSLGTTNAPTLNVFFTLFLGLLCIRVLKVRSNVFISYMSICLIIVLAEILDMDYGAIGVLSILTFYIFHNNFKLLVFSQIIIFIVFHFSIYMVTNTNIETLQMLQPLALLSLIPIHLYNGKPGPKLNTLFYLVYPAQFLIFYLIKIYL